MNEPPDWNILFILPYFAQNGGKKSFIDFLLLKSNFFKNA